MSRSKVSSIRATGQAPEARPCRRRPQPARHARDRGARRREEDSSRRERTTWGSASRVAARDKREPPTPTGDFTENELTLDDLAGVVSLISCGVEINNDSEQLSRALSHVEWTLRCLSDQVGATERRLGWRPDQAPR